MTTKKKYFIIVVAFILIAMGMCGCMERLPHDKYLKVPATIITNHNDTIQGYITYNPYQYRLDYDENDSVNKGLVPLVLDDYNQIIPNKYKKGRREFYRPNLGYYENNGHKMYYWKINYSIVKK